ncbi:hypothetical protein L3Q82_001911 [Scortum barcoo]|uniref:Uncharacterized protein n=1 Tax=Scortum barcoo TaxID=214431 RepID=A0ACB8W5H0_9TELE|nr:hypothetical protein L3Q82_001911 [Scortum barcoo]
MTLLLLPHASSSQMGTTESTEDLFRTLRTGACGTTSRSMPGKTKELVVDFRRRIATLCRLHRDHSSGPSYDSVVASAIFYGIVCWASSITDRDRRRMDRLDSLTALGSSFSERLLHPRCVKERALRLRAVQLLYQAGDAASQDPLYGAPVEAARGSLESMLSLRSLRRKKSRCLADFVIKSV